KELKGIAGKARRQVVKDYVAWPLISALAAAGARAAVELIAGEPLTRRERALNSLKRRSRTRGIAERALTRGAETYRATVLANVTANILRNLWSHAIIFCGHFPDQTYTFGQGEVEDETRGGWYVRQLVGAANIEGGPAFHVMSGNLGYQVEHHLFPDMPSSRYAEVAPRVKAICEKYDLPYNSGPFLQQWLMVQRTIVRLAFPGGTERPKPGPYRGEGESSANGHGQASRNGDAPETAGALAAFP
ncbi:MAG: NADPH-dependent stearoyl-CoA 9-desaturase, partial [Solirubrobacteraceae bacterium]|nr:NADPH-dependent stearoyl-CoA 9-desaturase [Solirubrobacteraceae bacterium]